MAFTVTDDPAAIDVDVVHDFLANESSWARGIDRETVQRAVDHSLCFAGLDDGRMVAFAPIITDGATVAYLADVFVLQGHRGRGYSKRLMEAVMAHPRLSRLRRFMLRTSDAHGLYAKFGFAAPSQPEIIMERFNPDVYTSG